MTFNLRHVGLKVESTPVQIWTLACNWLEWMQQPKLLPINWVKAIMERFGWYVLSTCCHTWFTFTSWKNIYCRKWVERCWRHHRVYQFERYKLAIFSEPQSSKSCGGIWKIYHKMCVVCCWATLSSAQLTASFLSRLVLLELCQDGTSTSGHRAIFAGRRCRNVSLGMMKSLDFKGHAMEFRRLNRAQDCEVPFFHGEPLDRKTLLTHFYRGWNWQHEKTWKKHGHAHTVHVLTLVHMLSICTYMY